MSGKAIVFADFVPGARMGEMTESITEEQLGEWAALYPWDAPKGGTVPKGLATVLMMRAYLELVSPRPPGNLHVRQQMQLHAAIRSGEPVTTVIACRTKELKGERRKLELVATGKARDGRLLYDGVLTLYWAG